MAFETAEQGNVGARDALLRIVQRDFKLAKLARAERLVRVLDGAVQGTDCQYDLPCLTSSRYRR